MHLHMDWKCFFSQINEVVRSFACSKNIAVCMKSARYVCEHHKNLRPNPWAKLLGTAWNWQRIQCLSIGGLGIIVGKMDQNVTHVLHTSPMQAVLCVSLEYNLLLVPHWCPTARNPSGYIVSTVARGFVPRARGKGKGAKGEPGKKTMTWWHRDGLTCA